MESGLKGEITDGEAVAHTGTSTWRHFSFYS